MTDRDVQIELNFIDEFELSRQGMIDEIKTEFDIIRFCVSNMTKYKISAREMFDRIMILPLRKLLCEKNSVLLKVCPDFKMFPLDGQDTALNDGLHAVLPPLGFVSQEEWLSMEDWKAQKVAYFDRSEADFTGWMSVHVYDAVSNALKGEEKKSFVGYMQQDDRTIDGDVYQGYSIIDVSEKEKVYALMEKVGYNSLNLYDFVKHLSDKRGAHIDIASSILIPIFNKPGKGDFSLVECLALQMIVAAEKQIPELSDYWPESLKAIEGI